MRQEKVSLIKITILEVRREFHSLIRISIHLSIYSFSRLDLSLKGKNRLSVHHCFAGDNGNNNNYYISQLACAL